VTTAKTHEDAKPAIEKAVKAGAAVSKAQTALNDAVNLTSSPIYGNGCKSMFSPQHVASNNNIISLT